MFNIVECLNIKCEAAVIVSEIHSRMEADKALKLSDFAVLYSKYRGGSFGVGIINNDFACLIRVIAMFSGLPLLLYSISVLWLYYYYMELVTR